MSETQMSEMVTLVDPIKRGDDKVEKVQLRKPKAGELRGLDLTKIMAMNADAMIILIPRISVPALLPAEVSDMDPQDFIQLADEVVSFFVPAAQLAELRALQNQ